MSVTSVRTCQHANISNQFLSDDLFAGHHPCTSPKIRAHYSLLLLHIYNSFQGAAVCFFNLEYIHNFKNCILLDIIGNKLQQNVAVSYYSP